ncbi:hypothetical Protein YC6258_00129 [Gynuella sunshinyii YC6258]|uniref:Uncharacterized protein n=1 Tax=Gynuella sunshinyii YC6258 TaxID=1445510 RepID=A0A0C5VD71_9GAMM|nr:hypothetical Protein YC6258_00129 [Gynuella sunshinyii YC6258]
MLNDRFRENHNDASCFEGENSPSLNPAGRHCDAVRHCLITRTDQRLIGQSTV